MKKKKNLIIIVGIIGSLIFFSPDFVFAEGRLPNQFQSFSERISEFQNPVSGETSIEMIKNFFYKNILPIGKYILIGIGIIYMAYYAYLMAIGMGTDDQYSSQQENIIFLVLGFAIIGAADILVSIVDPITSSTPSQPFDQNAIEIASRKIITYIQVPLGAIAIILLFYGAFKMIAQATDKESVSYGKNMLLYSFVGFAFVMLADPLVNLVFYPNNGLSGVGTEQAQNLIIQGFGVFKFLFIFFGVASFIVFLYAGFLYLTAGDSDDGPKKAKEAFKWSIIGLFVILISYSIAMFFLPHV